MWRIDRQTSNHQVFINYHLDSPLHLFFFLWKHYWKSCWNTFLRMCCHPPSEVSQATGGLWLETSDAKQAQSLWVVEVRMSQHPQPTLCWSNPQCWYRRWALLTTCTGEGEAMGQCHSSPCSIKAGKYTKKSRQMLHPYESHHTDACTLCVKQCGQECLLHWHTQIPALTPPSSEYFLFSFVFIDLKCRKRKAK